MKNTNPPPNANPDPDEEFLTAIFDQYALTMYKYALRFCHDPRIGDHIVGDTFATLVEQYTFGKGSPSDIQSYRSLLYQIAYNRIIQDLRDGRYKTSLAPVLSAEERASLTRLQPPDDQEVTKEALISALNNELTEDQRHVLVLHLLEGFSLAETARILSQKATEIKANLRGIQGTINDHPELLTESLVAQLRLLGDPTINALLAKKKKRKGK